MAGLNIALLSLRLEKKVLDILLDLAMFCRSFLVLNILIDLIWGM